MNTVGYSAGRVCYPSTAETDGLCTATLSPPGHDRTYKCRLPAGHYDGPGAGDLLPFLGGYVGASWHDDDPERQRHDGMHWADTAATAVPYGAATT